MHQNNYQSLTYENDISQRFIPLATFVKFISMLVFFVFSIDCIAESQVDNVTGVEAQQPLTQCGGNFDSQHIETYNGSAGINQQFVADHEEPVGIASMGCSGTLISPRVFISAGHCDYQLGDTVTFNFQINGTTGATRSGVTFGVESVIAQKNDDNDYAIIYLDDDAGDTFSFSLMSKRMPEAGGLLTIIGHPNGMPKQIAVGKSNSDIINGGFFDHRVDTLPGSSGSGVLNEQGYLVGIHTNGGCRTSFPVWSNEGMRMSSILEDSEALRNIRNGSGELRVRTYTSLGSSFNSSAVVQAHNSRVWKEQIWISGDFNGDGYTDIASVYKNSSGVARIWVHGNNGSGYDYQTSFTPLAEFWDSQRWLVGDFDGDGKDDLVNVYGNKSGKARAWVHRSTGSGFEYQTSFTSLAGFWGSQRWLVGDFDGDGKDDLVNVYGKSGKARAWVHRSTSSGFEYQTSFTSLAGFWGSQRWLVGDFDGDGKDDLVNVYGNKSGKARAWVHSSTGSGFEYQTSFTSLAGFGESQTWKVLDFDGDGKDDLINVYRLSDNRSRSWVHRSTGVDFEVKTRLQRLGPYFPGTRWLSGNAELIQIYASGDGK